MRHSLNRQDAMEMRLDVNKPVIQRLDTSMRFMVGDRITIGRTAYEVWKVSFNVDYPGQIGDTQLCQTICVRDITDRVHVVG